MDDTYHFLNRHVCLLFYWFMETTQEIDFLNILLPLLGVIFIIAISVFLLNQHFQKNLYQQKLEREELRNKHQKQLLQSNIEAQESERKRIAKDLHDELGATLSIARMHLMRLEQMHPSLESKGLSLSNVRSIIDSSIASVRQISHHLMPNQLEAFGLIRSLESMIDQINESKQIKIELNVPPSPTKFSWEKELSLYRIFMELIQNTLKHSKATKVEINYREDWENVYIEFKDNGVGLPNEMIHGLGLKNMEARIKAIGGSIEFIEGDGFTAQLKAPIENSNG
ncbi:sensor histidine kinase [Ekhidna sp.]|uniref:sensor histidine kinase n=2 Tax=Ekhidna sp. TaxID=2608089 RepID=UPI003514A40E